MSIVVNVRNDNGPDAKGKIRVVGHNVPSLDGAEIETRVLAELGPGEEFNVTVHGYCHVSVEENMETA